MQPSKIITPDYIKTLIQKIESKELFNGDTYKVVELDITKFNKITEKNNNIGKLIVNYINRFVKIYDIETNEYKYFKIKFVNIKIIKVDKQSNKKLNIITVIDEKYNIETIDYLEKFNDIIMLKVNRYLESIQKDLVINNIGNRNKIHKFFKDGTSKLIKKMYDEEENIKTVYTKFNMIEFKSGKYVDVGDIFDYNIMRNNKEYKKIYFNSIDEIPEYIAIPSLCGIITRLQLTVYRYDNNYIKRNIHNGYCGSFSLNLKIDSALISNEKYRKNNNYKITGGFTDEELKDIDN